MPHPERACEPALGSVDGRVILESVVRWLKAGAAGVHSAALQGMA